MAMWQNEYWAHTLRYLWRDIPENINNTAIGSSCKLSGDYVRLLHAVPNEYNYGRAVSPRESVDEEADKELFIFNRVDESIRFIEIME